MQEQQEEETLSTSGEEIINNNWVVVPIGSSNISIDACLAYECSVYGTSGSDDGKQFDFEGDFAQPRVNHAVSHRPIHSLCMCGCLCQCSYKQRLNNPPILIGTDHGDLLAITATGTTALRLICVDQMCNKVTDSETATSLNCQKRDKLEPSFNCIAGLQAFGHGIQISLSQFANSELSLNNNKSLRLHGECIAILPQPSSSVFVVTITTDILELPSKIMPAYQALKLPEHDHGATILAMSCATMTILHDSDAKSRKQLFITFDLILTSDDRGIVKLSSFSRFSSSNDERACHGECDFGDITKREKTEEHTPMMSETLDYFRSVQLRAHCGPCVGVALIDQNHSTGRLGSLVGTFATGGGDQDPTIRIWSFTCTVIEGDTISCLAPSFLYTVSCLTTLTIANAIGTISFICPISKGLNGVYMCAGTLSGNLLLWGVGSAIENPDNKQDDVASWRLLSVMKHTNNPITCVIACSPDSVLPGLLLTGDSKGTCRLYRAYSTGAGSSMPLHMVAEVTLSGPCRVIATSSTRLRFCSSSDWGFVIMIASENGEIKRWYEAGLPLHIAISSTTYAETESKSLQRNSSKEEYCQHQTFNNLLSDPSEIDKERMADQLVEPASEGAAKMKEGRGVSANQISLSLAKRYAVDETIGILREHSTIITNQSAIKSITTLLLVNEADCEQGNTHASHPHNMLPATDQNVKLNQSLSSSLISNRGPRNKQLFVPTAAMPPKRPPRLHLATNLSTIDMNAAKTHTSATPSYDAPLDCKWDNVKVHRSHNAQKSKAIKSKGVHSSQVQTKSDGAVVFSRSFQTPNPLGQPSLNSSISTFQEESLNRSRSQGRNEAVCASDKKGTSRKRIVRASCRKESDGFGTSKKPLMYKNLISIEKSNVIGPFKTLRKQVSKDYTNKMMATFPSTEDLWPDESELIPKLEIEPPVIPNLDLLDERIHQENEFALKMVLQEAWWMDPY